jgi:hypothetical protein
MYEPEDFLETLSNMIAVSEGMLESLPEDDDLREEITTDIARLRDLHLRIRLQFGLTEITWH